MSDPYDIVVIGSCMIDLVCYVPRLPKSGETICGTRFNKSFGGKGCNQSVAAKKLGANPLLVARVGNDTFGKTYQEKLLEYNMSTDYVKPTEGISTGAAQIIVSNTGENQIVIVLGANEKLSVADIEGVAEYIINSEVMICQLEVPHSTIIKALEIKSRSKKGRSILNAAPAHPNLDPSLYSLPDIFCVNETEAEMLTNLKVTNPEDAKAAVSYLIDKGCKQVIITLGENGAVFGSKESPKPMHVPTAKVTAVDTTGAGDAFIGALAYYLATNPRRSMRDIVKRANLVATVSVQKLGTQESFPSVRDLPF